MPKTNETTIHNPEAKSAFSTDISLKTEGDLINHVYRNSMVGLLASSFLAIILLLGLIDFPRNDLVVIWITFFAAVTVLRSVLVVAYTRSKNHEKHWQTWRQLYVTGTFLGGLSWGLAGGIIFPYADSSQQILIVLLLAGTTAGSVPLISAVLSGAVAFVFPALLPIIFNVFLVQSRAFLLFGTSLIVYLVFLLIIASKTHSIIRNAIAWQYENMNLLKHLSDAKEQLEFINLKLESAATHDPLTNVANRNLFITNLETAMARAKKNNKMLALLYIDLDGFKNANDIYGHHVGDQLLLTMVSRLETICENTESIARLGGDEFTIIVENVSDPYGVAEIAKKICKLVATPFYINTNEVLVSASIGIGMYPIDSDNRERLINIADHAMYEVKQKGGNNYRFNVELLTE